MKEVKFEEIQEGTQFIMTWSYNGKPWATTLKMDRIAGIVRVMSEYKPDSDDYVATANDYGNIINSNPTTRCFVVNSTVEVEDAVTKYNRAMGIIK